MSRKKRPYGTGTVFKRKSDGRWIGRVERGVAADGTRLKSQVSATTEREAHARLDALVVNLNGSIRPVPENVKKLTPTT